MEGMTIKRKIKSTTKSNTVYISNSHSITAFTKGPTQTTAENQLFFFKKSKIQNAKKKRLLQSTFNKPNLSTLLQEIHNLKTLLLLRD